MRGRATARIALTEAVRQRLSGAVQMIFGEESCKRFAVRSAGIGASGASPGNAKYESAVAVSLSGTRASTSLGRPGLTPCSAQRSVYPTGAAPRSSSALARIGRVAQACCLRSIGFVRRVFVLRALAPSGLVGPANISAAATDLRTEVELQTRDGLACALSDH